MNRILGRPDGVEGVVENDMILHKIENMTGTRVLVAPYDPSSWRRCFLLLGEEELITRAVTLLSGAIAQGMAPTRDNVRQMLALQHDPDDPLLEQDARLEEIRQELKDVYKLRMVEVQVSARGGWGVDCGVGRVVKACVSLHLKNGTQATN